MRGAATAAPRGGGEVLPRSRGPGNEGACRDGSQWACALVWTAAGGAALRVVDRGRSRDPYQAGTQAEDGSPGCAADSAIDDGRSLSADLGAELGESRSAATVVASAPDGAGPHPDHEPVASGGAQRRATLQEEVVAGGGTGATGSVPVSTLGQPAEKGSAGVAGPTEPDDCGADANHRAGSGEVSRGAALADASRGRFADGTGFRADHRESGTVSVWQTDRELSGTGAVGRIQRGLATSGTTQQAKH